MGFDERLVDNLLSRTYNILRDYWAIDKKYAAMEKSVAAIFRLCTL